MTCSCILWLWGLVLTDWDADICPPGVCILVGEDTTTSDCGALARVCQHGTVCHLRRGHFRIFFQWSVFRDDRPFSSGHSSASGTFLTESARLVSGRFSFIFHVQVEKVSEKEISGGACFRIRTGAPWWRRWWIYDGHGPSARVTNSFPRRKKWNADT